MHEPLFEGTTGMNVVSRSASMVLASEVWSIPIGVRWLQSSFSLFFFLFNAKTTLFWVK